MEFPLLEAILSFPLLEFTAKEDPPGGGVPAGRARYAREQLDNESSSRVLNNANSNLDTELLLRVRAGDHKALGELYNRLFPLLWRIAVLRTHNSDVAKDLVHEVFLSLWLRRDTLRSDLDLRSYCAAAIRNQAQKFQRHEKIVSNVETAVANEQLDAPGLGQTATGSTETAVEDHELHAIYQQALADLDDRERTVALLRWEEGFSFAQIADVLGTTKMGARHILLRAQQKVQRRLSAYRP